LADSEQLAHPLKCQYKMQTMPPTPDAQLELRILNAAQHLWGTRGEKGFTLRAIATKAGTTTPTVYKRFRNKEAIRIALARHLHEKLNVEMLSCSSVEQLCREYLRFAETRPNEYRIIRENWAHVFGPGRPRPLRAWILRQLAIRFGGRAEDYAAVYYALFFLVHGGATMLTAANDSSAKREMKKNCVALCDRVLKNARGFRNP
jgi:AcrR family transcriptional regulator